MEEEGGAPRRIELRQHMTTSVDERVDVVWRCRGARDETTSGRCETLGLGMLI